MGIFLRLREERERLGFSQEAFGVLGGVQKRAQINYEKGERHPDSAYLAAIAAAGADVLYILTGQRAGGVKPAPTLTAEEETMLGYFRDASKEVRRAALGALLGASSQSFEGSQQVFHKAPKGGVAGRDIVKGGLNIGAVHGGSITQGNVTNTGPVTFHAPKKTRK